MEMTLKNSWSQGKNLTLLDYQPEKTSPWYACMPPNLAFMLLSYTTMKMGIENSTEIGLDFPQKAMDSPITQNSLLGPQSMKKSRLKQLKA